MKTVGLVVEYNPLHNGHVHHFERAKEATGAEAAVAVMSGHFLQRGEPAVADKWARTEMALHMGADLVLELPVAYACQPAEWFAYGAVGLLDAAGVVNSLCFGSENGQIEPLLELAKRLYREPEGLQALLKSELKKGGSYPAAFASAVSGVLKDERSLSSLSSLGSLAAAGFPNTILGLHYLISLLRLESGICPVAIPRLKAGYHQTSVTDADIASATAIRKLLLEGGSLDAIRPLVPSYTADILHREWSERRSPISWDRFVRPLLLQVATRSAAELSDIYEVTEGLENRIPQCLRHFDPSAEHPFEELIRSLKTKRYTHAKLQRTLLRILLNHKKHELDRQKLAQGPGYLRVLGFSKGRGRELLRAMKKKAKLPVVTKVTREHSAFLDMDIRATAVYALGCGSPTSRDLLRDYYEPPLQRD